MGAPGASRAIHHGDFDDDEATVRATLARILNARTTKAAALEFHKTGAGRRGRRNQLAAALAAR